MGHEAAYHLESKNGHGSPAAELLKAMNRIQTSSFNYAYFHSLSLLVIDQRPDADVWEAVFNLTNTLSHATPPPSAPASFDETPVTRSSSSFQGSEHTKKILEPALFHEIEYCTYRNVSGFFQKYFEDKSWERRSKVILRSVNRKKNQGQKWYISGRWAGLADQPHEDEMWDWLSRFQTEFLSKSPGLFNAAKTSRNLTGAEAKRQVDVLMKMRTVGNSDGEHRHDWKDVRVIGELKQSEQDFKPLLLQLSRYARDIFTSQPTRRFLHAFTMRGKMMEAWVFDRSGPYSSGEFDIHSEPEKFIKVITGYTSMSDAELGLDTYSELKGTDRYINIGFDISGQRRRLQLETMPLVKQRATVCRGTTCFRTSDQEMVVKFSWTSDKRHCESKLLELAHEKGVEGVAELVGYQRLTMINELRSGMTFPSPHQSKNTNGSISGSTRCLVLLEPFRS